MDVESPKGSCRIRVRMESYASALTGRGVFRIEDEAGQVLRRIHDARHGQEAIALYWRSVGMAMPGAMMGKDLERRISRARIGMRHHAMQTPELPFLEPDAPEPAPEAPETEAPEADAGAEAPAFTRSTPMKRGRPKRIAAPVPQIDLFAESAPELVQQDEDEPEAQEQAGDQEQPRDQEQAHEEKAAAEAAPDAEPVREQPEPEPRLLDAQTVMLQQVDPRNLRPTDRSDSYLYHVTNGPDSKITLRQGLVVSASDPVILTERQGVAYWLSVLADDYDYIMDGPADFVVLRLRRMAVEDLLEPDPHASRSAGCPCYLLTGGAASREQAALREG